MKKFVLATLIGSSILSAQATMAAPTLEELWDVIQKQNAEIEALKKEQAETDVKVEATADALESGAGVSLGKSLDWASKTKIGGYGEIHYNNFDGKNDQVDIHRFVLFAGHEFNDKVRFFSELEVEHGLVDSDDAPGEVEVEQAYIEWDFAENHSLVSGQFLIPVGILNETHEPETFYGTERNLVEKNIIPVTWWEAGVMISGQILPGLSYDVALHSGLNTENANIRSGRQKVAEAVANDNAYTARIKYTAVPGLELAATYQHQEDISQGEFSDAAADLFEAHVIYNVGDFSVRALGAVWNIDGEEAEGVGTANEGRDKQEGFYIEPSYKVTEKLGFFVRYSEWDNRAGFTGSEATEVVDYGLNYWLLPNVVFKADVSDFDDDDLGADSVNFGVGWSF